MGITGRTHQLRVHCAAIGHPILADPAYGIFGEACPDGGIGVESVEDRDGFWETRPSLELQREIDNRVRGARGALVHDGEEEEERRGMDMCLHARELGFIHPVTGAEMLFECPPSF